jgi:hypothetical protein
VAKLRVLFILELAFFGVAFHPKLNGQFCSFNNAASLSGALDKTADGSVRPQNSDLIR